ncbi:MAG: hypothetical protein K8T91_12515 [Planctomycetes bacterium]|nr:hypothetical protein [Planctomycetota bacterium]
MNFSTACETRADAPDTKGKPAEKKEKSQYHGAEVVFVDVRYILQHYSPLKTQLDTWSGDLMNLAVRRETEQKEIQQRKVMLRDIHEGTQDYERLEKDIVKREVESEATWKSEQRQLVRKRAKIFFDVYQLIRTDVSEFMKENEILSVLNFDGNPTPGAPLVKPPTLEKNPNWPNWGLSPVVFAREESNLNPHNSPEKVEQMISSNVLVVSPKRDITPWILQRLNSKVKVEEAKKKAEGKAEGKASAAEKADIKDAKK